MEAIENDFQNAPYVEVLTPDGVTVPYKITFDNKTGEATLFADNSAVTPPKELLKP